MPVVPDFPLHPHVCPTLAAACGGGNEGLERDRQRRAAKPHQ